MNYLVILFISLLVCINNTEHVIQNVPYIDQTNDYPTGCESISTIMCLHYWKINITPDEFIDKVPTDGLCGKTDEDNLGFTYDVLDKYIRTGEIENEEIKEKIDTMHEKNLFKLQLMPTYVPS